MKDKPCSRLHQPLKPLLLIAGCILPGLAPAQATDPTTESDPVFELSPFLVSTYQDQGFVATNSLAGGRLSGLISDTPVAYSALTRDLIDALSLTDMADMAEWFPNTVSTKESGELEWSRADFYLSSRGVTSNKPMRDFFPYSFNFDSYNIDRFDQGRGPNSILWGNTGYGSNPNIVSKKAYTEERRTDTDIRFQVGSWDYYRATLDHNLRVSENSALRLNALFQDSKSWRDKDFEKREAITLAGLWRPSKATEIRFEAEHGSKEKAALARHINDHLSAWNGVTTFDSPISRDQAADGVRRQSTRTTVFTPSGGDDIAVNYQNWARTEGGNLNANYPAGGQFVVGPSANIRARAVGFQQNLPDTLYDLVEAGSNFRVPDREHTNWVNGPLFSEDYYNYTLSIIHHFRPNLIVEFAANVAEIEMNGDLMVHRGLIQTFIDINSVLPTGDPNPNFLEPYAEARAYPLIRTDKTENLRLAMAYLMDDFKFGKLQFNLLGGISRTQNDQDGFRYVLKSNPDPREWPTYQEVRFRYYLNTDHDRPYDLSDREWTYVDPVSGTTETVAGGKVRDPDSARNQRANTEYNYLQAALTAQLLEGKLNLLAAVRYDDYETSSQLMVNQYDNPSDWNGYALNLRPDAPANYTSLTYRLRDSNGNPFGDELPAENRPRISGRQPDARYASDVFQDDFNPPSVSGNYTTVSAGAVYDLTNNVSLFANHAESFVAPIARFDIFGELLEARTAEGQDYGLRYTALEGKFVGNLIYYEGVDEGNITSAAAYRSEINAIAQANPVGDLTVGGLNKRGLAIPPNGALDTIRTDVSGWEIDITANLTRNWRLILNGAITEGDQSGTFPRVQEYMRKNDQLLRQVVQDAGGIFEGNRAVFDPNLSVEDSPEGPNAVTSWNDIQDLLSSITADRQKLYRLTESTANFYTDYTFRGGPLSGLRIGGGLNYRGKQVIGYRGADTIPDPSDPAKAIDNPNVGPLDVVYQPDYTTATATVNYTYRINDRMTLYLTLRVDNLFDYDDPIYYRTIMRPVGGDLSSPAREATALNYFWINPRSYKFTVSLRF